MLTQLACQARAIALTAQTAHWFTYGPTFKPDHDLFGDLYTQFNGYVDSFAERAVGLGLNDPGALAPAAQAAVLSQVVCDFAAPADSLTCLLGQMGTFLTTLDNANQEASVGTQDLIAGIADAVEVSVYLVTQRLKSAV